MTLLTWARELRKLGCRIDFVGEGGRLAEQVRREGFPLHLVSPCRHPSIFRAFVYVQTARRLEADVLIGVGTFTGMEAALAAFTLGKPLLLILNVSPRDMMWLGDSKWRFPAVAPAVVVNKAFGDLCVRTYGWPPEQICYIPHRIDLAAYAIQGGSFQNGVGRICILRRLDPLKAQAVTRVLKKMEHSLRRSQAVTVTIAGDGDKRGELESTVCLMNHRLGRERVRLIGYVDDTAKLFRDHSVVLGSERCAIEALSAGRTTFIISNSGEIWPITFDHLELLAEDNFVGDSLAKRNVEGLDAHFVIDAALHHAPSLELKRCQAWVLDRYDASVGGRMLNRILVSLVQGKQKPTDFLKYLKALLFMYRAVTRDSLLSRIGALA